MPGITNGKYVRYNSKRFFVMNNAIVDGVTATPAEATEGSIGVTTHGTGRSLFFVSEGGLWVATGGVASIDNVEAETGELLYKNGDGEIYGTPHFTSEGVSANVNFNSEQYIATIRDITLPLTPIDYLKVDVNAGTLALEAPNGIEILGSDADPALKLDVDFSNFVAAVEALDNAVPDSNDTLLYIKETAAISRVVRGTVVGTLGGLDAAEVHVGGLEGVEGTNFSDSDDGTELAAWINLNLASVPANSVVDNGDGTFDITFSPGTTANAITFSSEDPALTFTQTTAGSNVSSVVNTSTVGQLPIFGQDVVNYTDTGTPLTVVESDNGTTFTNLGATDPWVTFEIDSADTLPDGWTATFIQSATLQIAVNRDGGSSNFVGRFTGIDGSNAANIRPLNTCCIASNGQYSSITVRKCGGKLNIVAVTGDWFDND